MNKLVFALSCVVPLFATTTFAQTYSVSGGSLLIPGTGTGGGGTWPTVLPPTPGASSVVLPLDALSLDTVTFTGLAHSWVGDAQLVLDDPNGGRHNLIMRLGFIGSGFGSPSDFSAANTIVLSDAGAPFPLAIPDPVAAGTYAPHSGVWTHGNLGISNSALSAIPVVPGGVYTLRAYDWEGGDSGSLSSWSLAGSRALAINVDINAAAGPGAGVPSLAYAGAGVAGVWNSVPAAALSIPLVDDAGGATGVTISGTAGSFGFNNVSTTGDDERLLDDVADIGPTGSSVVYTLSGLPSGTYEVTVYAWAPDDRINFLTDVTVANGLAGTQTCGGAAWSGVHVQGATFVRDNCRVQNGTIAIDVTTAAGFGSFNGLQLRQLNNVGGPQNYCAPGVSLNGCAPTMGATGTPSVVALSGFTVTMSNADGMRIGGMFYGLGPASIPFGNGTAMLCTSAPRKRLFSPPTLTSGTSGACDGSISIDLAAFIAANPGTLGAPFSTGDTVYIQGWNRDNGNGSKNLATSDGLKVTFTP